MKNYPRLVILIFFSSLLTCQAFALPKSDDAQRPILIPQRYAENTDLTIPGDSPVKHCADPANDIFTIDRLDVLPNPPRRGESCIIEIEGTFRKDVGNDPRFMLNATFDSVHSIDTVEKLCDHVDVVQNQALVCPPLRGRAVLSYVFFIHELMMPPGNYTQRVDAYNQEEERLFCLTAAVTL